MKDVEKEALHVSLVVVPDATISTVTGLYEAFVIYESLVPDGPRFFSEIVAPSHHFLSTSCGLPFNAHNICESPGECRRTPAEVPGQA